MSQKDYYIRIKGVLVAVNKDVYLTYYRAKRRMRYFESDIKKGTPIRDEAGNISGYSLSKEVSLEQIDEDEVLFMCEAESIEDAIITKQMSETLHRALVKLPKGERELIEALFFSNDGDGMSERECAKMLGIRQQNVNKRKQRILSKLKKIF